MTNVLKVTLSVLVLVMVLVLLVSGLNLQNVTAQKQVEIDIMLARKEDLLVEQQRLEELINSLNETVKLEVEKQNLLLDKLGEVESSQAALKERELLAQKTKDVVSNLEVPKVVVKEVTAPPASKPVVKAPTTKAS